MVHFDQAQIFPGHPGQSVGTAGEGEGAALAMLREARTVRQEAMSLKFM